jgi:hypothetical protein
LTEIDGRAVLRRIIEDGVRVRADAINTPMAEAAERVARELLPQADAAGRELLTEVLRRLEKVLAARRRRL